MKAFALAEGKLFLDPVGNRDIITRMTGNVFSDISRSATAWQQLTPSAIFQQHLEHLYSEIFVYAASRSDHRPIFDLCHPRRRSIWAMAWRSEVAAEYAAVDETG